MIKLENPVNAPVAFALLTVQAVGDAPAISLGHEIIRRPVSDAPGSAWVDSKTELKQTMTYIDGNGSPVTIEGTVPEEKAVQISAAHKVVIEVRPTNRLRAAFAAGKISREDAVLEIVRVVEVWSTPTKCLYGPQTGQGRAPGSTMDMGTGRISKSAAA